MALNPSFESRLMFSSSLLLSNNTDFQRSMSFNQNFGHQPVSTTRYIMIHQIKTRGSAPTSDPDPEGAPEGRQSTLLRLYFPPEFLSAN